MPWFTSAKNLKHLRPKQFNFPNMLGPVLFLSGRAHQPLPSDWRDHPGLESLHLADYNGDPVLLDLSGLVSLKKLTLQNIPLSGLVLPPGLEELKLVNNALTKWPEARSGLPKLRHLHVENQVWKTLPDGVGGLGNLETLRIESAGLQRLPEAMSRLANLRSVVLNRNRLKHLPAFVARLKNLERLEVAHNQLTVLPENCNWTELHTLDIRENRLTALPPDLARCRRLRHLKAGNNRLGNLPDWIGGINLLATLGWEKNGLDTWNPALLHCRQLEELRLDDNRLSAIPEIKAAFPYLLRLGLSGNPLPRLPELPARLKELDLAGNEWTAIPEPVFQLLHLERLNLDKNKIGAPPETWGPVSRNLKNLSGKGNPGKWPQETMLELRRLTQGAGWLTSGQWAQLLSFLELARLEDLPERLYGGMFRLMKGDRKGAEDFGPGDWRPALQFPGARTHLLVRKAFKKAFSPKTALRRGSKLWIWGATHFRPEELKRRLEQLQITLLDEDPAGATHCLLGFPPFQEFRPSGQVWLSENELMARIYQLEKAPLFREKDPGKLSFLRDMLLSPLEVNRDLALRMLWDGGLPPALMETLREAWQMTRPGVLRERLKGFWGVHLDGAGILMLDS